MKGISIVTNSKITPRLTRIPARLLARELTANEIAQVGGAGGTYTKTFNHGEMGDYVSP